MKQRPALAKLKFSILNCQFSILLMVALFASPVRAQVTIGSNTDPHGFSLLEIISNAERDGGLRLPQLTTAERDGLTLGSNPEAKGLVIFNTTVKCLEFWNGSEWISLCNDVAITITVLIPGNENQTVCKHNAITPIVFTTSRATSVIVTGLPAGVTGNFSSGTFTISGIPTESGIFNYKVIPTDGMTNGASITGTITVNDFTQTDPVAATICAGTHTFTLAPATGTANITYQWQQSPDNTPSSWVNATGTSTNANYTTPVLGSGVMYYRRVAIGACGSKISNSAKVTVLGFLCAQNSFAPDDSKFVEIDIKVSATGNGTTDPIPPAISKKFRFLNYNLGADPSLTVKQQIAYFPVCPSDITVYGGFYQWGRKNIDHTFRCDPSPNVTSDSRFTTTFVSDISKDDGKFVYGMGSSPFNWVTPHVAASPLWGNGGGLSQQDNTTYTGTQNSENPCPAGWRVPTEHEWALLGQEGGNSNNNTNDEFIITGSAILARSGLYWVKVVNGRANALFGTNNQMCGYAIYTKAEWEKTGADAYRNGTADLFDVNAPEPLLFLPAAGSRNYSDGARSNVGTYGNYWSSTVSANYSFALDFYETYVRVENSGNYRSIGYSVRCVAEHECVEATAGAASSSPTVVVNETMTAITHATTGATGIGTATGLPAGVSASFADNTITISGTPTAVGTGTFNYSIPLIGGCGSETATGTIKVLPVNGAVTTFTNVMYDFQHQTLEAYPTTGTATAWRWQVSKISTGSFVDIPDAPNSKYYTVPANFADTYRDNASAKTDSLFFRCIITVSSSDAATGNLNLLFIRTNTAGYSTSNGVRYLTIQKGGDPNGMKIALTNLGASEGDDAGDLGDFYQWGRIADGHEHVVWRKGINHVDSITPFGGAGNTSGRIAKPNPAPYSYTSSGQIPDDGTATDYYGKFITYNGDWGAENATSFARWGTTSNARPATEITWTHPENNPCPSGWRVPSKWNIWDIYQGGGSGDTSQPSSSSYLATVNNWYWHATANNTVGGAIITNASGERVFLPATGSFNSTSGHNNVGIFGIYWSSTYRNSAEAINLQVTVNNVVPGVNANSLSSANGMSVRCVAEPPCVEATAGAASSSPTVVVNEAMTAITHATTGATGIGTATGLPAGVSASFADNTITVSGTPTSATGSPFNYSIPLIGGCGSETATGTITVLPVNGAVTTFTNVMYDFQHQTLEAYPTSGTATAWRWQVSKISTGSFVDIPGAPNSNFYTVPANFADSYRDNASAKTDSLFFRCILTVSSNDAATGNLNLLFIRTNTAGYGTLNGVRYLTIQKGKDGVNTPATTGTIKIALTSLGASEGDDAGDLGDHYQWGRIADGHEHVVWSKNASHTNQILPFGGVGNTSGVIAKPDPVPYSYTAAPKYGQIPNDGTATGYYGKFITVSSGDWGAETTASNARWGNSGLFSTRASDISLSDWTYPENNPCPTGWRVPSRWNIWDIYGGTGSGSSTTDSNYLGTVNGWYWHATTNNAYGGAMIMNASGERVFLPATGYRNGNDGSFSIGGYNGYYLSSTYNNTTNAYSLRFASNIVQPGTSSMGRGYATSVRCVAE